MKVNLKIAISHLPKNIEKNRKTIQFDSSACTIACPILGIKYYEGRWILRLSISCSKRVNSSPNYTVTILLNLWNSINLLGRVVARKKELHVLCESACVHVRSVIDERAFGRSQSSVNRVRETSRKLTSEIVRGCRKGDID